MNDKQIIKIQGAELRKLRKQNDRLRAALAPFACLGRGELRQGDFNRAFRVMRDESTQELGR